MVKNKVIKEDINFLEWPMWSINERTKSKQITIEKPYGRYELRSAEELPSHFDRIVLYSLLYSLRGKTLEVKTTRYKIAKHIFDSKATAPHQYARILTSLKKWKAISISFDGVFYEGDKHTIRFFGIIDDVIFNKETKELYIRFNQQYIQQLNESKFYKYIDFEKYKKLSTALSARLYEVLSKNFKERADWFVKLSNIAEKLTIEKRPGAANYYASDVVPKLQLAISEINKHTELKLDFHYDPKNLVCHFKQAVKKQIDLIQPARLDIQDPNYNLLINHGVSKAKTKLLLEQYPIEKITDKINLLKKQDIAIKNTGAWLCKALEEDWSIVKFDKESEEKKLKAELAAKKQKQEQAQKELELKKFEYAKFKEKTALEKYSALSKSDRLKLDKEFENYYKSTLASTGISKEFIKPGYLIKILLAPGEQDFQNWMKSKETFL